MGWGEASFPDKIGGFFWVYIIAPIIGGILAALFFTKRPSIDAEGERKPEDPDRQRATARRSGGDSRRARAQ